MAFKGIEPKTIARQRTILTLRFLNSYKCRLEAITHVLLIKPTSLNVEF